MYSDTIQINLKQMLIAVAFVVGVVFLGVGTITNEDPLWFLPVFQETPGKLIVYQRGCVRELFPGQPGFDALTQAINQSFIQVDGFYGTYGLSDESLKHYRAQESAVEVSYLKPVTIHAPYRFGHPDSIFIGLSGYVGEDRAIFGGHAGNYWASALRLKSIQAIQHEAEQIPCPAQ